MCSNIKSSNEGDKSKEGEPPNNATHNKSNMTQNNKRIDDSSDNIIVADDDKNRLFLNDSIERRPNAPTPDQIDRTEPDATFVMHLAGTMSMRCVFLYHVLKAFMAEA